MPHQTFHLTPLSATHAIGEKNLRPATRSFSFDGGVRPYRQSLKLGDRQLLELPIQIDITEAEKFGGDIWLHAESNDAIFPQAEHLGVGITLTSAQFDWLERAVTGGRSIILRVSIERLTYDWMPDGSGSFWPDDGSKNLEISWASLSYAFPNADDLEAGHIDGLPVEKPQPISAHILTAPMPKPDWFVRLVLLAILALLILR